MIEPEAGTNTQTAVIETRLRAAKKLAAGGDVEQAERIFLQALKQAESVCGETGALTGMVLIDLVAFYESQGRADEAKPLWDRVRLVLLAYVVEGKVSRNGRRDHVLLNDSANE